MWPFGDDDEFEDGDEGETGEAEPEDDDDADDGGAAAEAEFARVDAVYRKERGEIRQCLDLAELRSLRAGYEALIRNEHASDIARVRAADLVESIDDRVTDVKAKQLAERER